MRVGVDSYSYHRLLGEIRPGEQPPPGRISDGGLGVIREARRLGVDGVSLETCFLASCAEARALAAAAAPLELVFAWGAPNGLQFGASPAALRDLLRWIEAAAAAGSTTMRIVVAGPALRNREPIDTQLGRTAGPLRTAARHAREAGVRLAVENHGDLTAAQIEALIDQADTDGLGVCFDTANAVRVGDEPLSALRRLADRVLMVHLKDVAGTSADPIAGPCSVPYGTGVVPIGGILDLLALRRFAGLVCVELGQLGPGVDEIALVEDSVGWLRSRRDATPGGE